MVECVISLGPNLFYNSSMVSCLLIKNNNKPKERKGKVLFIQAVNEIRSEKTMSYLNNKHITKIQNAYKNFLNEEWFSSVIYNNKILEDKNARLNIQLYVEKKKRDQGNFGDILADWNKKSLELNNSMSELFKTLKNG